MAADPPRILHLFPVFAPHDPAAARAVRMMNALGAKVRHAIVSDNRDERGAARRLAKGVQVSWPRFPPLAGSKLPGRLMKLAGAMAGHDLICTYGAGALDAALAHTLFADVHKLAPLVHHEFDADPGAPGGRRRGWYRRFALGRTAALIVPDRALEATALEQWDQPRTRVCLIPDGIDTRAFAHTAARDALPGLIKRKDEHWLVTFAETLGDDPRALVRLLAELTVDWQLVIAGAPAARAALEAEAEALGVEDRLHLVGEQAERAKLLGLTDILALPEPEAEACPLVMQGMAAALPLVLPRGGAAGDLVASENGPLLFDDAQAMGEHVRRISGRADERKRIGKANRAHAREHHDEKRMVERTWALYGGLMGRQGVAD